MNQNLNKKSEKIKSNGSRQKQLSLSNRKKKQRKFLTKITNKANLAKPEPVVKKEALEVIIEKQKPVVTKKPSSAVSEKRTPENKLILANSNTDNNPDPKKPPKSRLVSKKLPSKKDGKFAPKKRNASPTTACTQYTRY